MTDTILLSYCLLTGYILIHPVTPLLLTIIYDRIMNEITLYGIKNCDTVKKARKWLEENSIEHTFHDVRADGLDEKKLDHWLQTAGWETVLNKRGTTWRKLDADTQQQVNEHNVSELLLEHPAMIKRPVLDVDGNITIGFKADNYQEIFNP